MKFLYDHVMAKFTVVPKIHQIWGQCAHFYTLMTPSGGRSYPNISGMFPGPETRSCQLSSPLLELGLNLSIELKTSGPHNSPLMVRAQEQLLLSRA